MFLVSSEAEKLSFSGQWSFLENWTLGCNEMTNGLGNSSEVVIQFQMTFFLMKDVSGAKKKRNEEIAVHLSLEMNFLLVWQDHNYNSRFKGQQPS